MRSSIFVKGFATTFQILNVILLEKRLKATSNATMMTAIEIAPMYVNAVWRVILVSVPLHSFRFIPNTEAKKDRGRKMIVKMVKIITDRD